MPNVTADHSSLVNALCENGARCMWQLIDLGNVGLPNIQAVECWWLADGRLIIAQAWKNGDGWNYFVETRHTEIGDCLTELGLSKPAPDEAHVHPAKSSRWPSGKIPAATICGGRRPSRHAPPRLSATATVREREGQARQGEEPPG